VQTLDRPFSRILITSQDGGWGVLSKINERDGYIIVRNILTLPQGLGEIYMKKKKNKDRERDT
jgi:hypothetical protein